MPTKKLSPQSQSIFNFFVEYISTEQLDAAECEGCLFSYKYDVTHPYARDPIPLKRWQYLMMEHLQREPLGMFVQSEIQPALIELKHKLNRPNLDASVSLRLQSWNYMRLYRDLRDIKNASTTQVRLQPHIKTLINLMANPSAMEKR